MYCVFTDPLNISFDAHYNRDDSSTETLHCTAFFSNRGKTPSCAAYASRDILKRSLGRAFTLTVVGFMITPSTFGARIALSPRQLALWGKDDFEGMPKHQGSPAGFTLVTDSPKHNQRVTPPKSSPTNNPGTSGAEAKQTVAKATAKSADVRNANPFAALMDNDSGSDEDSEIESDNAAAEERSEKKSDQEAEEDEDSDDVTSVHSDAEDVAKGDEDEDVLAFEMNFVKLSARPRLVPVFVVSIHNLDGSHDRSTSLVAFFWQKRKLP